PDASVPSMSFALPTWSPGRRSAWEPQPTRRVAAATAASAARIRSGRRRQAFDRVQCAVDLALVQVDVLELAREVLVVRAHVEVAVAGQVEEDRLLLPRLVGGLRDPERAVDRVGGLGRGQDPLAPGELHGRGEDG